MSLITILVYIIIVALIWWAITFALANLPLPAPIAQFARVIATLIIVIMVVMFLLQLIGGGGQGLNIHL